jgi:hypothetical protein
MRIENSSKTLMASSDVSLSSLLNIDELKMDRTSGLGIHTKWDFYSLAKEIFCTCKDRKLH